MLRMNTKRLMLASLLMAVNFAVSMLTLPLIGDILMSFATGAVAMYLTFRWIFFMQLMDTLTSMINSQPVLTMMMSTGPASLNALLIFFVLCGSFVFGLGVVYVQKFCISHFTSIPKRLNRLYGKR